MKRNDGRPHMKSNHKGLLLAVSFSILSLTALSICRYGYSYPLKADNKQTTFTLTINSSNCPMFRSGSNATSSQVLTSLGNPIKLNRSKTKDDLDLTNDKNALLLKGCKTYRSYLSIDESTPFYSLNSITVNYEVIYKGAIQKDDRITCYKDLDLKQTHDISKAESTFVKGSNYFALSPMTSYRTDERQVYISSITVEYSCLY